MMKILINKPMEDYRVWDNVVYHATSIVKAEVGDSIITPYTLRDDVNQLSVQDSEALQVGLNLSANEWAVQQCLNREIYIYKQMDAAEFAIRLLARVYLTPKDITYWRLRANA